MAIFTPEVRARLVDFFKRNPPPINATPSRFVIGAILFVVWGVSNTLLIALATTGAMRYTYDWPLPAIDGAVTVFTIAVTLEWGIYLWFLAMTIALFLYDIAYSLTIKRAT